MADDDRKETTMAAGGVARAVLRGTLEHPVTLYSTAAGFLGGMTWLLLDPTLLFASLGIGGLALGVGSWFFNYFVRGKTFEQAYLKKLSDDIGAQSQHILASLQKRLEGCGAIPGAEQLADQSLHQFKNVSAQFSNFTELLAEKLNPTELTFGRYRVTAEQVYLSVLDNLEQIASQLASVKTIDVDYLHSRLGELRKQKALEESDREELDTLEERAKLREAQLEKVNVLVTRNEQAMTKLDAALGAVADMKTRRGHASVDLEFAMKELEELSKRASRY